MPKSRKGTARADLAARCSVDFRKRVATGPRHIPVFGADLDILENAPVWEALGSGVVALHDDLRHAQKVFSRGVLHRPWLRLYSQLEGGA